MTLIAMLFKAKESGVYSKVSSEKIDFVFLSHREWCLLEIYPEDANTWKNLLLNAKNSF